MSRKDYVAIAKAIRESLTEDGEKLDVIRFVNILTSYLSEDNPRFNLRKFEEAALPQVKDDSICPDCGTRKGREASHAGFCNRNGATDDV